MGVLAGPSDWMLCNEGGQKTPHQSRGNSGHSAVWPQTTFNNRKFFTAVCLDVVIVIVKCSNSKSLDPTGIAI